MSLHPEVTVIIPVLNEERYIGGCLTSILAGDYPGPMTVLVLDGGSTDGTRAVVDDAAATDHRVRLLENPKRTAPAALNIGIREATGEILIRVDAHAVYQPDYVSRCVGALLRYSPDNVGGVCRIVPRSRTLVGEAIAASLSHRFGIGNAAYRLANATKPEWVDTVPFFCCKKDLFERFGLFNEQLTRTQDLEFNHRITRSGGRILLCPDIEVTYFARSGLGEFAQHNWKTGLWVIMPFIYSDVIAVSWRHMTPLLFVLSLFMSAAMSTVFPFYAAVLAAIIGIYAIVAAGAGLQIAISRRDWRYAAIMPLIFGVLHTSYGLGSLYGLAKLMRMVVWGPQRGKA